MNLSSRIVTNIFTHKQVHLAEPVDNEIEVFEKSILVTETNLEGIIVYTNRRYESLSGFSEMELLGSPHCIVRHPDMPKGVFKAMWKIIQSGKIWRGYIKHLCKDGSFFWTLTYIQVKVDKQNNIIGYTSSAKVAYGDARDEVEKQYKKYYDDKHINRRYFMASENYQEEYVAEYARLHE